MTNNVQNLHTIEHYLKCAQARVDAKDYQGAAHYYALASVITTDKLTKRRLEGNAGKCMRMHKFMNCPDC